jgi:hypothetical protein
MHRSLTIYGSLAVAALFLLGVPAAGADTSPIRVEINHAEIVHLDADAQIVHIANPAVADVVLESPRLLFIVGLAPGETGLFVLDANGNELINTDLLVTPNLDHEVTVNRNAVELTYSCSPRCVVTNVPALAAAGTAAAGGAASGITPTTSALAGEVPADAGATGVDGGDVEAGN